MNILLIAPLDLDNPGNGGYNVAANSLYTILSKMTGENDINQLSVLNSDNILKSKISMGRFDVAFVLVNPNTFSNPQVFNIFNSILSNVDRSFLYVFWETTPLPSSWNDMFKSNLFSGYIASSFFVCDLLKEVSSNVFYIPMYNETDAIVPISIDIKKGESFFNVLFIGQNTKRKGVEDTITSFSRVFSDIEEANLILKVHTLSDTDLSIDTLINYASDSNCKNPKSKIYIFDDKLSTDEIYELYRSSSILLFPSRGEGFGLPIMEAMNVGLPVIYTNWSSSKEVGESEYNYPVNYTLDEAQSMYQYGYEYGSMYAVPLMKDLMHSLRVAYTKWKENRELYYKTSIKNRDIIDNRYNYTNCKKYMLELLK